MTRIRSFDPDTCVGAVELLKETGAANVGGRQQPVGKTIFTRAVAIAMTTPLGAGDARYRIGGPAGPVDTVYLGVFQREALEAVNGYNPSLRGNEDYEINYRIRKHGGTVWFDPGLAVNYHPRRTPYALARQYFRYGRMKASVCLLHPTFTACPASRRAASGAGAGGCRDFLTLTGFSWVATSTLPGVYVLFLAIGALTVGPPSPYARRAPSSGCPGDHASGLGGGLLTFHTVRGER